MTLCQTRTLLEPGPGRRWQELPLGEAPATVECGALWSPRPHFTSTESSPREVKYLVQCLTVNKLETRSQLGLPIPKAQCVRSSTFPKSPRLG